MLPVQFQEMLQLIYLCPANIPDYSPFSLLSFRCQSDISLTFFQPLFSFGILAITRSAKALRSLWLLFSLAIRISIAFLIYSLRLSFLYILLASMASRSLELNDI